MKQTQFPHFLKQIIPILLTLVLLFSVVSCGEKKNEEKSTDGSAVTTETVAETKQPSKTEQKDKTESNEPSQQEETNEPDSYKAPSDNDLPIWWY